MRTILAVLAITMTLLTAACVPAAQAGPTLDGTSWLLATLDGQPHLAGVPVTLNFDAGRVSGTDGCNRYSGSYTGSGGRLSVGKDIISTKMACPGPVMQQAQVFVAALTGAAAYRGDGQQLTLLDAAGKVLATFTVQSASLAGTSWIATGYNNGKGGVVSPIAGTSLTLAFSADGTVSGKAGCNAYGGKYEVSGKTMKFGALAATLMACPSPSGVMEQESLFLKALSTVVTYRIEANQLQLRTADGAVAVTFAKAP